ncbi:MAG: hypothetical protein QXT75_00755 [Desulfurococcaceae archaeon]
MRNKLHVLKFTGVEVALAAKLLPDRVIQYSLLHLVNTHKHSP